MKQIHWLTFVLLVVFCIPSFGTTRVIRLNQLTTVKDASPIVREVLQKVADQKDIVIELPAGKIHFFPDKAFGKYHDITNHDNGFKFFAFPLIGMKNVTIRGNNTELIFHGHIIPFLIEGSSNIKIEGVNIDWELPFLTQGRIIDSNPTEKYYDVEFENYQEKYVGAHIYWDSIAPRIAYKTTDYLISSRFMKQMTVELLKDSTYRIRAPFKQIPPKGLRVTFKGKTGENRICPAFHVIDSRNIALTQINVYHAGGMGLIAEKSENIHLNGFNVRLREGSKRLVSTTADATHFCNCKGAILVENCLFENMLDDALNIHGTYMKVSDRIDDMTLGTSLVNFQQFGYVFAKPGDEILIVKPKTLLPFCKAVVKSIEYVNDQYTLIHFDRKLPAEIKAGYGLDNMTWSASLIFRNNVVRNNRARSILLSSPKKMLIENNSFSSQMSAILLEGDLDYWYESGSVSDLIIQNNIFLDCMYGGGKGAVIWVNPHVKKEANSYYEKNIRIENNTFRHFDRNLFNGFSIDGLTIRNNTIEPSNTYPPLYPSDTPFFVTDHVTNTRF